MNKRRREQLKNALSNVESASVIIQGVCNKEEDCIENYPENLQNTDGYEKMEDAVEYLNDAIDKLDDVREAILAAMA